ncbi:MAG TPA: PEGA domain-containing protein [Candidatus Acidoferrum sp.]|jgi:hypothetical protein
MRSMIVAVLSFAFVTPACGNMHKDTYPVACSELWPAVKETLKSSNYGLMASDEAAMTASFTVGYSLRQRTNSVALVAQGSSCEMQLRSSYRGLAHDDAGDFKTRVDQSLAKLKASGSTTGIAAQSQNSAMPPKPASASPEPAKGTVNVSSNPTGAELTVDGELVGKTPAALKLTPGKHSMNIRMAGYKEWSREVTVQSGSELQLGADLEK